MTMDMGLSWSPGPNVLMKGLILFISITPIKMAHTHIELAHLVASILSHFQVPNLCNLFIYLFF